MSMDWSVRFWPKVYIILVKCTSGLGLRVPWYTLVHVLKAQLIHFLTKLFIKGYANVFFYKMPVSYFFFYNIAYNLKCKCSCLKIVNNHLGLPRLVVDGIMAAKKSSWKQVRLFATVKLGIKELFGHPKFVP